MGCFIKALRAEVKVRLSASQTANDAGQIVYGVQPQLTCGTRSSRDADWSRLSRAWLPAREASLRRLLLNVRGSARALMEAIALSCDRSPEPPPFSPLIVTLVSIALVVGARLAGLQIGAILNTSESNAEDRLTARQREERPARHSTLDCRASGAAQRRVWTTPRCASPATTLSSFSWSGTNRVQPGTEAARFTSFHFS